MADSPGHKENSELVLEEAEACNSLPKEFIRENRDLGFTVYILKKQLDNQVLWWQSQKELLESHAKDLMRRLRILTFEAAETTQRHGWELKKKAKEADSLSRKLAVAQERLDEAEAEVALLSDRLAEAEALSGRWKEAADLAREDRDDVICIGQKYKEDATELMRSYKRRAKAEESEKAQALDELKSLKEVHQALLDNHATINERDSNELKELQKSEKELEAALKKQEEDASGAVKKMEADFGCKLLSVEREMGDKDKELAALRAEIRDLKEKVDELQGLPTNGIDKLGEDHLDAVIHMVTRDSSEDEIIKLKDDLAKANFHEEELHTNIKNLRKELNEARRALKAAEEEEDRQEAGQKQSSQVSAMVEEKWALVEEVAALKGQLQLSQEELKHMWEKYLLEHVHFGNEDRGRHPKSVEREDADYAEIKRHKSEAEAKQEETARIKAELARVRQSCVDEVVDLERRLAGQDKRLAAALQGRESAEDEAKRKAMEAEEAKADSRLLQERLASLESQLREAPKKSASESGHRAEPSSRNLNQEMEAAANEERVELNAALEMLRKRNAVLESDLAAALEAQNSHNAHGSQDPESDARPTREPSAQPPRSLQEPSPPAFDKLSPGGQAAASPGGGGPKNLSVLQGPEPVRNSRDPQGREGLEFGKTGRSELSMDTVEGGYRSGGGGEGKGGAANGNGNRIEGSKRSSDMDTDNSSDAYDIRTRRTPKPQSFPTTIDGEPLCRKRVADILLSWGKPCSGAGAAPANSGQGTATDAENVRPRAEEDEGPNPAKRTKKSIANDSGAGTGPQAEDPKRTPLAPLSPTTHLNSSNPPSSTIPLLSPIHPPPNNATAEPTAHNNSTPPSAPNTATLNLTEKLRMNLAHTLAGFGPPSGKRRELRATGQPSGLGRRSSGRQGGDGSPSRKVLKEQKEDTPLPARPPPNVVYSREARAASKGPSRLMSRMGKKSHPGPGASGSPRKEGSNMATKKRSTSMGGYLASGTADLRPAAHLLPRRRKSQSSDASEGGSERSLFYDAFFKKSAKR